MADVNKELEGYPEFTRATDRIMRDLPETMDRSANEFASEWVAAAKVAASTGQEQLAAASLIVSSGEIQASSPLFFGAEFGGQGRPTTMQFPPFQGRRGYFFYPARRANEDRLAEIWGKGIDIAFDPWDRNG